MLSGLSVLQLPSWPVAPDVTTLQILSVTVLIPLAIAAVVTLLVMGPGWRSEQ